MRKREEQETSFQKERVKKLVKKGELLGDSRKKKEERTGKKKGPNVANLWKRVVLKNK